ncbi:MAG TPA: peroxiredoxin [Ktedonobacterales bacterium]|nr:peroxiredoxin [Ktedonobacterales bacterium]
MSNSPLKQGDLAPEFALPNEAGEIVSLASLRGQRVVVYFYPMDDTPGCTLQACNFRDAAPQIEEQHAVVLGISPDDSASHQAFKTKYQLPFQLLVDADHTVAQTYGAWQEGAGYITRSQVIIDESGHLVDVQVPVKATESLQRALDALTAQA